MELVCPAGSPTALRTAVEAGADAVVIGSSVFKTPDPVQTMRQFNKQLQALEEKRNAG